MSVGTVFLGVVLLVPGPAGKNAAVILTFVGGAALWGSCVLGQRPSPVGSSRYPKTVTSAAGSLTLAGALVQSARIRQAGACSACADEEHADQVG